MSKEITLEEVRKGDRIRMAREITVGRDPVLLGGGTVRADDGKLWVTYGATIELLDRPISIPTAKGAIVRVTTDRITSGDRVGTWILTENPSGTTPIWVSATRVHKTPEEFKRFLGDYGRSYEVVL